MWTITFKSITIFLLVSIAWVFGSIELVDTILNFSNQWYWFVLATLWTTALNDVFGHMILTHKLFAVDVNSVAYRIVSFLFVTDHGWGPITGFCVAHTRHHQCSDQGDKDVQNWRPGLLTHCIVSPLNYLYQQKTDWGNVDKFMKTQRTRYKDIFDDEWTWAIEEYSHILTIVFWTLLYFVCPIILFKIVFMGRLLLSIYTFFGAVGGHVRLPFGYRRFNTPDQSHNNLLLHYLSLLLIPSLLHNNHHGTKYTLEKGSGIRWYEYDFSKHIARFLKIFMEKKQ